MLLQICSKNYIKLKTKHFEEQIISNYVILIWHLTKKSVIAQLCDSVRVLIAEALLSDHRSVTQSATGTIYQDRNGISLQAPGAGFATRLDEIT